MNVTAQREMSVNTTAPTTVAFTRCAFFIFAKRQTKVWRKNKTASAVTSITDARQSVSSAQKKKIAVGIRW